MLLPKVPVLTVEHLSKYTEYDCTGFACYSLSPKFVDCVTVEFYQDQIIRIPSSNIPPHGRPFWKVSELSNYGFHKIEKLTPTKNPTLMVVTHEDEIFVYTRPMHFAIVLFDEIGNEFVAHKPNSQYLPEIIPLSQALNIYKVPGTRNEIPGVQYWELPKR